MTNRMANGEWQSEGNPADEAGVSQGEGGGGAREREAVVLPGTGPGGSPLSL